VAGRVMFTQMREVRVDDLLAREPVRLDLARCAPGLDRQGGAPDLARQMIRLCGLEPDEDVEIVFTGLFGASSRPTGRPRRSSRTPPCRPSHASPDGSCGALGPS